MSLTPLTSLVLGIGRRWALARRLVAGLLCATAGAGLAAPTPGTPGSVDLERQALESRVAAVREAIQAGRPNSKVAPTGPLAQWRNWPNWSNWSNWPNWGNFWPNR